MRADNSKHRAHEDSRFATAAFRFATQLSELFGEKLTFVVSMDDKAKVRVGLPAAKVEQSIVASLSYKVRKLNSIL